MDSPKPKHQHVDQTLKKEIEILQHVGSMKGIDICTKYGIKQSTLSTWKRQRSKIEEMVKEGKVLKIKCNYQSFLPNIEKALHIWFCEMRSKQHAPPLNKQVLVEKATLFAKQFWHDKWQGSASYMHQWTKRYGIVKKAMCGTKESATGKDQLEEWKETILYSTLGVYSPQDIYNSDETALFYKSLPHRTYYKAGEKPAGSAKCKDWLTLLIITNMDGSDHRKLSVTGKAKTPHCLQKKYKMQVKDMAVNWYVLRNAWMTGDIHNKIMSKFNSQMRTAGHHVLYVCDNASSHQNKDYSKIKFLILPPNSTSVIQQLDQGIIMSVKRRYKKKLAERYLVSVENSKDANALLKQLDIVAATNMVHNAWKETPASIIQNCFCKAGFKHFSMDLDPAPTLKSTGVNVSNN